MMLNRGEWSEIYAFLKIIFETKIFMSNSELDTINKNDFIDVFILYHNSKKVEYILDDGFIFVDDYLGKKESFALREIVNLEMLHAILREIRQGKTTTFCLNSTLEVLKKLKIEDFKGASYCKGDINIGFSYLGQKFFHQAFNIKSYLGGKPTLLNASTATNFIFKVENFCGNLAKINEIRTKSKVRDRICEIQNNGGVFSFYKCENKNFEYNMRLIDGDLIEILNRMLFDYYCGKGSDIASLITKNNEIVKIKRMLISILLGVFPKIIWDGENQAHGMIVVKEDGELSAFHIVKERMLKEYLFLNTKLETPSTSRHGFGLLYRENNDLFFKLNLQIRYK